MCFSAGISQPTYVNMHELASMAANKAQVQDLPPPPPAEFTTAAPNEKVIIETFLEQSNFTGVVFRARMKARRSAAPARVPWNHPAATVARPRSRWKMCNKWKVKFVFRICLGFLHGFCTSNEPRL